MSLTSTESRLRSNLTPHVEGPWESEAGLQLDAYLKESWQTISIASAWISSVTSLNCGPSPCMIFTRSSSSEYNGRQDFANGMVWECFASGLSSVRNKRW